VGKGRRSFASLVFWFESMSSWFMPGGLCRILVPALAHLYFSAGANAENLADV